MFSKRCIQTASLVFALCLAAAPMTVSAQRGSHAHPLDDLVDIEFDGGSLAEYLESLRRISPEMRIVAPDSVDQIGMPRVQLQDVAPIDALLLPGLMINGVDVVNTQMIGGSDVTQIYVIEVSPEIAGTPSISKHDYFDLEFKGGLVRDYVRVIREATGRANIVMLPGAESFYAPAVKLKSVTVEAALSILQDAIEIEEDGRSVAHLEVSDHRVGDAPDRMFVIRAHAIPHHEQGHIQNGVWSVKEILEGPGISIDDAVGALESALELFSDPAEVRFHEQTGILLARGPEEQIHMIERVLDEMSGQSRRLTQSQQRVEIQLSELRDRERELAAEIRIMEKETELANMLLMKTIDREQSLGDVDETDVAAAQLHLTRVRSQLELTIDELSSVAKAIERIENSGR